MLEMLKGIYHKGFFHLLSANFVTQLYGLLAILFVSKFLPPADVSYLKALHSYTSLGSFIGTFGFHTAVLKYCSDAETSKYRQNILLYSLRCVLVASLVVFSAYSLLAASGSILGGYDYSWMSYLYGGVILFSSLSFVALAYYQAIKDVKRMSIYQFWVRTAFFVGALVGAYFWGIYGVVIFGVLGYLLGCQVYLYFIKDYQFTKVFQPIYIPLTIKKRIKNIALYSMLGACCTALLQNADIIVLDQFEIDREIVGYYSLATIFVIALTVVVGTAQSITTPYFSEKCDDIHWIRKKVYYYQAIVFAAGAGLALFGYFGVLILVEFYYGSSFRSVADFYSVLVLRFWAWSSYAIVGVALLGLGVVRPGFYIAAALVVPAYILAWIGVSIWGVQGAAYAQVITFILNAILVWMLFSKIVKERSNVNKA